MPKDKKHKEIRHRFKFKTFIDVLDGLKENGHLPHDLEAHLMDTPFWQLIKACRDGKINSSEHHTSHQIINTFLACYDSLRETFTIRGKKRRITDSDISHILSLPAEGEKVEKVRIKNKKSESLGLVQKYFKTVERVSCSDVERAIESAKDYKLWKDVAALVITQLMISILFLNTSQSLNWRLLEYCDDIPKLKEYNWAAAVTESLKKSLQETNAYRGGCPILVLVSECFAVCFLSYHYVWFIF